MNNVYKITAKIVFPEGVAPGAGGHSNRQVLSKNGKNETVLRGASLAGVLRAKYANKIGCKTQDQEVSKWFGTGFDGVFENSSTVQIADATIECDTINERTHNMINRHTGAMIKGGLFSLESIPPMATTVLSITLKSGAGELEHYNDFIDNIIEIFGNDLLVGGNSNRGIGRMEIEGGVFLRSFDLDTIDGIADLIDAEYKERKNGIELTGDKQGILESKESLKIFLELGIPRGEDLLIGDGQEADYTLQPQSVIFADKTKHWRIPGSSLRGIIRGWMTRLAVRDGEKVRDSLEQWNKYDNKALKKYDPDLIGWGFIEKKDREKYFNNPELFKDPILDLFGSMYKKGRIHITDSFSRVEETTDVQDRMHVAIDRFSGGSKEGALFENQTLIGKSLKFPVTILITKPTENEINWLIKTLRALHLGILSVGSSKSGGRLEIKSISATGCGSEIVTTFAQEFK